MLLTILLTAACAGTAGQALEDAWRADFAHQPVQLRPRLEVRYREPTRESAVILGETYEIVLHLKGPEARRAVLFLRDGETLREHATFWLEMESGDQAYTSLKTAEPSQINLYRRGPYYCEVHWLGVECADAGEESFPAKGEVVLHCYPEKVHVTTVWHATGYAPAGTATLAVSPSGADLQAPGLEWSIDGASDAAGTHRIATRFEPPAEGVKFPAGGFAFAANGDLPYRVSLADPLPAGSLELVEGVHARYDPARGSYMIGGDTIDDTFNYPFYKNPHYYASVRFRLRNDDRPRKVYVCHEIAKWARGLVQGSVVLDDEGHPLPLTVQISKHFGGYEPVPFYRPREVDTGFHETIFPLYLEPGEEHELTSLHLYQNWGRHPVKGFSSLMAWMDYFHSSTGATETTCFVPYKFRDIDGVAIADLRPMSQRLWEGQPQHDNVAGHRFLMYRSGGDWHYSRYLGTTYRSTGPSWMNIRLDYLSDDGKIRARVDSFELPQTDELRNVIRLRFEVLEPLAIENLGTGFRLMDLTTAVQRLRYTHVAWQAGADRVETREIPAEDGYCVAGEPLLEEFPWVAVYGSRLPEPNQKGNNAFVVRRFRAQLGGQERGPAFCVQTHESGDINLALTVAGGAAELQPGDFVEAEFYLLPWGDETSGPETPQRDRVRYGPQGPRVTSIVHGEKRGDLPSRVRADRQGRAEFSVAGGWNLMPIIVEGLPDYRRPRLEVRRGERWIKVPQETVGNDGYQVFVDDEGTFGCVFLIDSDGSEQTYRVAQEPEPQIRVWPQEDPDPRRNAVAIQAPWMADPLLLRYPETIRSRFGLLQIDHERADMPALTDPAQLSGWHRGPGGSQWFDWELAQNCKAGGIATPREDYVDLEFWFYNGDEEATHVNTQFCLMLHSALFRDHEGARTCLRSGGRWVATSDTDRGAGRRELCHYRIAGGPDLEWLAAGVEGWGRGDAIADAGLIAVEATDGRHVLGLTWENPASLGSNWLIPCVHADPQWPACPPKDRVRVRGRLYLIEGSLEDLWERYEEDRDGLSNG